MTAAYASYPPALVEPPSAPDSHFAFAQLQGSICLIQLSDTGGALLASDVAVFRHEFITLFRFSHTASVHPGELRVLHAIPDSATLFEADRGTVFLGRDAMAVLQKLTAPPRRAYASTRVHGRRGIKFA